MISLGARLIFFITFKLKISFNCLHKSIQNNSIFLNIVVLIFHNKQKRDNQTMGLNLNIILYSHK